MILFRRRFMAQALRRGLDKFQQDGEGDQEDEDPLEELQVE
jgi:hypothetical protein